MAHLLINSLHGSQGIFSKVSGMNGTPSATLSSLYFAVTHLSWSSTASSACASCLGLLRRMSRFSSLGASGGNLMSDMRDAIGVLLAGGQGERLWPLTRDRAKPAVPFGALYRIIDITLSNCINSDLRRVFVLTQYKALSLNRHIRAGWSPLAGLGEYIEVLPPQMRVSTEWYQGTADAVYQNIYSIGSERSKLRLHSFRRPHLQDELRQDAPAACGFRRGCDRRHHRNPRRGSRAAVRRDRNGQGLAHHRLRGKARGSQAVAATIPDIATPPWASTFSIRSS